MATINFRDITTPNASTAAESSPLGAVNKLVVTYGDVSTGARSSSSRIGGPVNATASQTVMYKLRGWNSLTNAYEVWTSSNPYSMPPSNASLNDVTYSEFDT